MGAGGASYDQRCKNRKDVLNMSKQPDSVDGLELTIPNSHRPQPTDFEVRVGDIYRSRAGQPAYWWVVGITRGEYHTKALYIVFNMDGQITGVSKASVHYLRGREKMGHCAIPPLEPTLF